MTRILGSAVLAAALVLAACNGSAAQHAGEPALTPAAAAATITPDEVLEHIGFLASDELRGRATPSPGLAAAAAYIAREFERLGLQPAGDSGTFFQRYPLPLQRLDTAATRLVVRAGPDTFELVHGRDYFAEPGTADAAEGDLVYAGTSGVPPAAPALRGNVAVIYLPGEPDRDWQLARFRAREAAADAGAAAVIFVLDPGFPTEQVAAAAASLATPRRPSRSVARVPVFHLAYSPAARLFAAAGENLDALRARSTDGDVAPQTLAGLTAAVAAPLRTDDARPANVVAVLPGSDPELRDSYVVLTAHYDHVGVGRAVDGDSIYNGADDNASGTTALLETAEALAALPEPPARSVMFLAVSGEEIGLLGSGYFAEHPTVPLDRIVANINVDMIGRNSPDSIVVIGQEYSSLGPLVHEVAAAHPLGLTVSPDLWPEERFFFRSDHLHFARNDIPALFFFAGVHEDYHRPDDEIDEIDEDKVARVARLIFLTTHAIASSADPPQWTPEGLREVRALTR